MRLLLPLFIVLPILEMIILIQVGGVIGAIPTVGLVLLTAVVGLQLLRQQGMSTLMRANQKLASGEMPAEEVVEGLMLAVGGALLLTPGFVTDVIGFCCLVPQSRRVIAKKLIEKGVLKAAGSAGFNPMNGDGQASGASFEFKYSEFDAQTTRSSSINTSNDIEGEATEVKDDALLK